jgi:hypothetical protein
MLRIVEHPYNGIMDPIRRICAHIPAWQVNLTGAGLRLAKPQPENCPDRGQHTGPHVPPHLAWTQAAPGLDRNQPLRRTTTWPGV